MKRFALSAVRWVCGGSFLVLIFALPVRSQQNSLPTLPVPTRRSVGNESLENSSVAPPVFSAASALADSSYVLGPGDRLALSFFNVPEYDGEKQIAVDGSLTMPLIGKLPVAGLTLEEAAQTIERAYAPYLRTPMVTPALVAIRPIQIGISGEISKPGAYEIPLKGEGEAIEWPTVIEAIQLAGGITDKANVQQIELRRAQRGGRSEVIQIDLWDLLTTGSIQNDITLRYGDAINIPTSTELSASELTQLSAANFSPTSIQVTVVGEVAQPGKIEVEPNAPLNQALLAAGGFDPRRADMDEVELVRLNADGTVSQTVIPVAFDEGINEVTNPPLRNNDVVVVGRSGRATFSDNASSLLEPVGTIFSPLKLLLNLFD